MRKANQYQANFYDWFDNFAEITLLISLIFFVFWSKTSCSQKKIYPLNN